MAIELPDGRRESNDVLDALRLRAVHARELGYTVSISPPSWEFVRKPSRDGVRGMTAGARRRYLGIAPGGLSVPAVVLTSGQERGIQQMIETKSPEKLKIPSALWTRQAVQELIKQQVGIRLPIRTVGEYLRRWGDTPQRPVRKAYKQDPKAVAEWLEKTYPDDRGASGAGGWGDPLGR